MREIPKILVNQQAVKALDTKGFEAAMDVLRHDDPALSSDLFAAVKNSTETSGCVDERHPRPGCETGEAYHAPHNLHRALEDVSTLAGVKL